MKPKQGMFKQMAQMQARMAKLQEDLENETVEVSVGGGAVTVTVTGTQRIRAIGIDPEAMEDPEVLQDMLVAAVNEAIAKAQALASSRMQALTSGLGLPPGLI